VERLDQAAVPVEQSIQMIHINSAIDSEGLKKKLTDLLKPTTTQGEVKTGETPAGQTPGGQGQRRGGGNGGGGGGGRGGGGRGNGGNE
jgi:hypothetical protein